MRNAEHLLDAPTLRIGTAHVLAPVLSGLSALPISSLNSHKLIAACSLVLRPLLQQLMMSSVTALHTALTSLSATISVLNKVQSTHARQRVAVHPVRVDRIN